MRRYNPATSQSPLCDGLVQVARAWRLRADNHAGSLLVDAERLARRAQQGLSRAFETRTTRVLASFTAVAVAALVATAISAPKAKPPPKPTYIQQVHPQDSFDNRFGRALPSEIRVRTIPIVRELEKIAPPVDPPENILPVPEPEPRRHRARIIRTASLDLCARHKLRKVMVGRYKWRCR